MCIGSESGLSSKSLKSSAVRPSYMVVNRGLEIGSRGGTPNPYTIHC